MDFQLTAEQQALAKSARSFANQHLSQDALARAHTPDYAWDVARLLAGQSLMGMTIAESDGGQGAGLLDAAIAIEQLAQVCPKSADVFQAGNFGAIRTFASESVQVMGALGYSRETLAEYALRRTRGWMIAGGSVEILKNRIAEEVFEQRFDQRR
jgi:alkylation response protein AidB-like acyl-CoA dehydrogenase